MRARASPLSSLRRAWHPVLVRSVTLLGLVTSVVSAGVACSAGGPREPAAEEAASHGSPAIAALAPSVVPLLAHAADAPAWAEGARFRIAGRARDAATIELPSAADGTMWLGRAGSGVRLGVRRLEARRGLGRLDGGAVSYGDEGGPHATVFARGAAIEDLVVAGSADQDVGYDVALPSGWSLKALDFDGRAVVEVRDEHAVAFLRMTADAAWDARGREHRVLARVEAGRIHLRVAGDAPGPLVIDPAWLTAGQPIAIRVGGTSTPLGTGKVLLTGGGTATSELYDPASGTFSASGNAVVGRTDATATLLPTGEVVLLGGMSLAGPESSAEIYDPATGRFRAAGALREARSLHTATALTSGKILVTGGWDDLVASSTTEIFDPVTGTSGPGPAMAAARDHHLAVRLLSGKVLIIGVVGATEIFDPASSTLTQGATIFGARTTGQVATLLASGQVLVTGGCQTKFATICSTAAYLFDPLANGGAGDVTSTGTMTEGRGAHASTLLPDGRVLVAGGRTSGAFGATVPVLSAEVYDPVSAAFAPAGSLSIARGEASSVVLPSGDVLFTGGETGSDVFSIQSGAGAFSAYVTLPAARSALVATPLPGGSYLLVGGGGVDALLLDPGTRALAPTGSLALARRAPTATLLRDGRVLVAGDAASAPAETYDPTTATFTAVGKPVADRSGTTATLLPSGKVLFTGGTDFAGGAKLSSAELYDPATKAFSATGAMTYARAGHAATLLATGKVFVVGGSDAATAELYDPLTGRFAVVASPLTARARVATALLPSGKVLIAGGATRATEVYDPETGGVTFGASLATPRPGLSATLLPSGRVLLSGGGADGVGTPPTVEVFDPQSGRVLPTGSAVTARQEAAVALLPDGGVLIAGGHFDTVVPLVGSRPQSTAEVWDDGISSRAQARPALKVAPASARAGDKVTLKGSGFRPLWEGGASNVRGADAYAPTAIWMPLAGNGAVVGSLSGWSDTQVTWTVPSTALFGLGRLFVSVGGAISNGVPVEIHPAPQAAPCRASAECASGSCADGVCCDAACDGRCRACSAAKKGSGVDGVCGDVPPELDPARCALFRGSPCTSAAQCATGFCVDGVCCDAACGGQCEACDVEGSFGVCVPVSGAPHGGRSACAPGGADACAAKVCDGVARAGCAGFVGAKVACRAASCADGATTLASFCDGSGACPAARTQRCEPYVCAGDACGKAPCASDAECAAAYRCAIAPGATRGECVVRTDNLCDGQHTVTARDGRTTDCAPYRCDVQGCKTTCASSDDCIGGSLCETTSGAGVCVLAGPSAAAPSGGCATTSGAGARGGVALAVAAALSTLLGRARRRRERAREA
jgi:hypothetical protein